MDRVEGGRQWGRCGDAKAPVAELRSACQEADKWLKVHTFCLASSTIQQLKLMK